MISPLEKLPQAARSKLQDLELSRDAALDASHAAGARLNMVPANAGQVHERLARDRDRFAEKHRALSMVVSRSNQFVMEHRFVSLESAPPAPVELKPGETVSAAIANVRMEIADLGRALAKVKLAPLPVGDRQELVDQYVVELIRRGRPHVSVQRDRLKVECRGDMFVAEDVLALLAWAAPEPLARSLDREVAALPLPLQVDAMPANERIQRVAEIEEQLLILERREEALIERAAADDLDILRRGDASPLAVLGVVIVRVA
jgi:hypothetical protein